MTTDRAAYNLEELRKLFAEIKEACPKVTRKSQYPAIAAKLNEIITLDRLKSVSPATYSYIFNKDYLSDFTYCAYNFKRYDKAVIDGYYKAFKNDVSSSCRMIQNLCFRDECDVIE